MRGWCSKTGPLFDRRGAIFHTCFASLRKSGILALVAWFVRLRPELLVSLYLLCRQVIDIFIVATIGWWIPRHLNIFSACYIIEDECLLVIGCEKRFSGGDAIGDGARACQILLLPGRMTLGLPTNIFHITRHFRSWVTMSHQKKRERHSIGSINETGHLNWTKSRHKCSWRKMGRVFCNVQRLLLLFWIGRNQ